MSRKHAERLLARVIKNLSLQTAPSIIKHILKDLRMDSLVTRDEGLQAFLKKIPSEPISIKRLVKRVNKGLLNNPPLCELLSYIEEEALISDEELKELSPLLQVQLNLLAVFEACAVTMGNSFTFNEDIYNFTKKQRYTSHTGSPVYNLFFGSKANNFSLFKNLKLISVDPVITQGAFVRSLKEPKKLDKTNILAQARLFTKKHGLSLWNIPPNSLLLDKECDESVKNVSLNVLEATWEEEPEKDGSPADNAFAGAALITLLERLRPKNKYTEGSLILPRGGCVEDGRYNLLPDLKVNSLPKIVSQFSINKEWMDLYNAWNLFFVIRNLDYRFLPIKLLIPSVLDAIPAHYMEMRVFVLYLVGNLFHYNDFTVFPQHKKLANVGRIMEKWGELNKQYADSLLVRNCPDLGCTASDMYMDIFGASSNAYLAYYLTEFATNFSEFRITSEHPKAALADEECFSHLVGM